MFAGASVESLPAIVLGPTGLEGTTLDREAVGTPVASWWTGTTVGVLVVLGAVHSRSQAGRDYPVLNWEDRGPSHLVHLLGYEEPNDGQWVWVVEAEVGPARRALLFDGVGPFTTGVQAAAFERVAAILNWLTYHGVTLGPTPQSV